MEGQKKGHVYGMEWMKKRRALEEEESKERMKVQRKDTV